MFDTPEDAVITALSAERDELVERLRYCEGEIIKLRKNLSDEKKQHDDLQHYVAIVREGRVRISRDYWDNSFGAAKVQVDIRTNDLEGAAELRWKGGRR